MSRHYSTLACCAALTLTLTPRLHAHRADTTTITHDQTAAPPQACVALMLPSVQGAAGSATDVGSGVRDLFASFLNGPSIKTVTLEARLESQAVAEAKQKSCGHVLVMTLTVKHPGGGMMSKAIGQGLGAAAWYAPVPGGSVGAAAARTAVIGGAQTVSTLASSTKAKDEMQLEYRVASSAEGDRATTPHTEKAKARTDREDLLTPLAERAAKTIVGEIVKP